MSGRIVILRWQFVLSPRPTCFLTNSAESLEKKRVDFLESAKSAQEFEKKVLE